MLPWKTLSMEDNGDRAEGVRMPELYLFTEVTEPALVGGKGANLGVLTAAGFQVPPGFVVGADAYVRFLDHSGLREEIEKLLGGIDYTDPEDLERRTADIRAAVLRHEMSPELADRIGHAYADLGDDPYVAVRSSATKEDSATASY